MYASMGSGTPPDAGEGALIGSFSDIGERVFTISSFPQPYCFLFGVRFDLMDDGLS